MTVFLASHHEKLAESAPSEASSTAQPPPLTGNLTNISGSTPAPPAAAESSTSKDKTKKEPVTKRDHLDAAADLMSDIQVETYSSMDKREKTEL